MNEIINNLSEYQNTLIIVGMVAVLLLVGIAAVKKTVNKQTDFEEEKELPFNIKDLESAIGGLDNINSVEGTISKVTLKLKDNNIVNLDEVNKLGCSGIVETSSGYTFIFGSLSKTIANKLENDLKG